MGYNLTQHIDIALVVMNAFFLFFFALVVYLQREGRREGYPLEHELTGRVESEGGPLHTPARKAFRLPFGQGLVYVPSLERDPVQLPARRTDYGTGSPIEPTGNPLVDGIGPAAWANRAKHPDLDWEGHTRIVPMHTTPEFSIAGRDADPRGYNVIAADGAIVGKVSELWIDKADRLIRYLQVSVQGENPREVLAPMMMATVRRRTATVTIDAIVSGQWDQAPGMPEGGTVITLYEEERVQAYFGGGYLYATPERSEPLL